jgi:uncharacterized protein YceH (UPF0502 family)
LRTPPLVAVLPRQPGTKESRYMHLFSGNVAPAEPGRAAENPSGRDRLTILESEVANLREQVAGIQEQLAAFRKQFE